MSDLLQIKDLTKRYGAVTVLDGCRLEVRSGEIHALLGANGAGKSTLVKIVAGLTAPHSGEMRLSDRLYAPANKQQAESAGVQIVQQELNLISTLSVAENLLLSRLPNRWGVIRGGQLHHRARAALDRFGLQDVDTDTPVGSLGVGRRQIVEIAAALDSDCKLLILDEPTAALSAGETDRLMDWLRRLRDDGTGIIYISHRLDEVSKLADRATFLRDGKYVGTHSTSDLTGTDMVGLMTGEESESHPSASLRSSTEAPVAMRVEGISAGIVRDVSLTVHRGERLGIAGLVGSGRTELLRAIFGADVAESGSVFLGDDARPRRFHHPAEAVASGLAMVTEDRKQNGLLLTQSICVNATLSAMWHAFSTAGVIRRHTEDEKVRLMCDSLGVHCSGILQTAGTLSGGNQQKVVIAKWLVRGADVFLFDEPTRGIDVAARRRIFRLIDSLADQGRAVVIVSSDLDELLETCDRIAVMSGGHLVKTFRRSDWSREEIMQAAFSKYMTPNTASPESFGR